MEAPLKPTASPPESRPLRRRKRRSHHLSSAGNPNPNPKILFSLTLASLLRPSNPSSKPSLNLSLRNLFEFIHSKSEPPFLNPILSLLPLLLRSKCDEVACHAARIVGAVALCSIQANEKVAMEGEILRGLVVRIVRSEKKKKKNVKKAMCDAVLDVATTSFGRQRLIQLSALNYLMLGFVQLQKSLASSFSVNIMEREA